jgi:hypothetical protein
MAPIGIRLLIEEDACISSVQILYHWGLFLLIQNRIYLILPPWRRLLNLNMVRPAKEVRLQHLQQSPQHSRLLQQCLNESVVVIVPSEDAPSVPSMNPYTNPSYRNLDRTIHLCLFYHHYPTRTHSSRARLLVSAVWKEQYLWLGWKRYGWEAAPTHSRRPLSPVRRCAIHTYQPTMIPCHTLAGVFFKV